jgi:hypothetical protein
MISYDDALHRYSNHGEVYRSATQLVSLVKPKFDIQYHSKRMAEQHGKTPGYWKRKWKAETDRSLVVGNNLHSTKEELDLAQGVIRQDGKLVRVLNPEYIQLVGQPDYWYWPPGMYPELILWNHEAKLAGRADRVYLGNSLATRYADIEDHKTNKRLASSSYFDYTTRKYRMLLAPLDHLMDCELVHYTLQLSLYQWMLEQMGFAPGVRRILHYPPLPEGLGEPGQRAARPRIMEIPYLRTEVETLIQHGLNTPVQ